MGKIFGPVEEILQCHELFYAALTARTMTWTVEQRVGDIFPSSVSVFRGKEEEEKVEEEEEEEEEEWRRRCGVIKRRVYVRVGGVDV